MNANALFVVPISIHVYIYLPFSSFLLRLGAGSRFSACVGWTLFFSLGAAVPSFFGSARPQETLSVSSLTSLSLPLPPGELFVQFEKVGSLSVSVTS